MEIQDNTHRRDPITKQSSTVRPGSRISYAEQNSNDTSQAEMLSRVRKAPESKRNWYDIKVTSPSQLEGGKIYVDLSQLTDPEITDENVLLTNEVDFNQAKSMELYSRK